MKRPVGKSSVLSSATVIAAIISGLTAVATAVLPWILKTHDKPVVAVIASNDLPGGEKSKAVEPITPIGATNPMPNLTFGAWSIVNSIDEAGTDFSGSTLKFISQRESGSGLEATGFFEWRSGSQVLGREYVVANFDAASRHIFIEGKSVESPTGILAVGSFSARVSDDGRQLENGTWGNTPGNQVGILGKWQARR